MYPDLRFSLLMALLMGLSSSVTAAETFELTDAGASQATVARVVSVTGEGEFIFQGPKTSDERPRHPVSVEAAYKFLERRLPGSGPNASEFRALRRYAEATSRIDVGGQSVERTLRESRQWIVARLTREGIEVHSPDGPLTATEIEMLPTPGDNLMLAALLPKQPVGVGQDWSPDDWTAAALAGVDVAFEKKISCQLVSVEAGQARVTFSSDVEGGVKGTTVTTNVSGEFTFDVEARRIVSANVTHQEERAVGPLSPGMKITLEIAMRSQPAPPPSEIDDARVAEVGEKPPTAEQLSVEHTFLWGVTLVSDRDWQLFQRTDELLILRLLDSGGIIAQCNMIRAATVKPGTHTDEQQFQQGIHDSLGVEFEEIVKAEEILGGDKQRIYRVIATGGAEEKPRHWRYYLVTAPDGRQVSFVFTVEPRFVDQLGDRDLELVKAVRFEEMETPTPAE